MVKIKPNTAIRCKSIEEVKWMNKHTSLYDHLADMYYNGTLNSNICFGFRGYWSFGTMRDYKASGFEIIECSELMLQHGESKDCVGTDQVDHSYITCELIDGTVLDFDRLAILIEEFGTDRDMITFKNNNDGHLFVIAIIPKTQIKKIDFVHTKEEINQMTNAGDGKEQ